MSNRAFISLIERFERILAADTSETKDKRMMQGEYPYIPYDPQSFLQQIEIARTLFRLKKGREEYPTFVDVGCGLGSKCFLAREMGFQVTGIEKDERYAKVASELLGNNNVKVVDALGETYDKYDVIYFYCPISDSKKERKLEERIVETAKRGAIIIPNYHEHRKLWYDNKKVRQVDDYVYIKKSKPSWEGLVKQ